MKYIIWFCKLVVVTSECYNNVVQYSWRARSAASKWPEMKHWDSSGALWCCGYVHGHPESWSRRTPTFEEGALWQRPWCNLMIFWYFLNADNDFTFMTQCQDMSGQRVPAIFDVNPSLIMSPAKGTLLELRLRPGSIQGLPPSKLDPHPGLWHLSKGQKGQHLVGNLMRTCSWMKGPTVAEVVEEQVEFVQKLAAAQWSGTPATFSGRCHISTNPFQSPWSVPVPCFPS